MERGTTETRNPAASRHKRRPPARSLPTAWPFTRATIFSALHYLGIIGAFTAAMVFLLRPDRLACEVFLSSLAFCVVTWPVAYLTRRTARCPLCCGTPLASSGARPHSRAVRIFPLNHGVTATLSILATQKFRCMYCGSDFDLMKTPSHRRGRR